MTSAPAGIDTSAPTAVICPPCTRMIWFAAGRSGFRIDEEAGADSGDRLLLGGRYRRQE